MTESLKEVIERLKAQKNSQPSKPVETRPVGRPPTPRPVEAVKPMEAEMPIEEEIYEDEEIPQEQEKTQPKPSVQVQEASEQMTKEQQTLMEIEMLQNPGRFRAELLFQLQELNKAIVTIASILLDKSGQR